jgi:DNA-binding NarL/FixJ family response regulator
LIAEQQAAVRLAVSGFLRSQPDLDVVGEADNSLDLVAQVEAICPDLMLLDWDLPGRSVPDVILALRHLDCQNAY